MTEDYLGLAEVTGQGTLAEQLFHQLTEAILQGEIPLGSKISEPTLAQRYGVSRGPLREALHRLQERHLITRHANQGARVVEATPETLNSIYRVREMLEALAARGAAERMGEADIAGLRAGIARHEAELSGAAPSQPNALGSPDKDFHFRIAQACDNPLLIELLCNKLYPLLRLYRSRNDSLALRVRAVVEHRRILDAIEEKDADMSELMMRRHISAARERRLAAMAIGLPESDPISSKRRTRPSRGTSPASGLR